MIERWLGQPPEAVDPAAVAPDHVAILGVEAAGEGDLQRMATEAESGKSDVDFLRKQLVMALGDETFARAHARLQTVCEEEDDDVLVNDIQQILGAKRLDKLPMILKLIFLEGGGATIS